MSAIPERPWATEDAADPSKTASMEWHVGLACLAGRASSRVTGGSYSARDPAKLSPDEFQAWLDDASADELEAFGRKGLSSALRERKERLDAITHEDMDRHLKETRSTEFLASAISFVLSILICAGIWHLFVTIPGQSTPFIRSVIRESRTTYLIHPKIPERR